MTSSRNGPASDRPSVNLELVWRCNLACVHCYLAGKSHEELSAGQWTTILDKLRSAGVLRVLFTGGEPFLRRNIFDLIAVAREKKFAWSIFTNATLLTPVKVARLAALKPVLVGISIHALTPAVHDAFTGVPGSHGKALAAARRLRDLGAHVQIKASVTPSNIREIPALAVAMAREGFRFAAGPSIYDYGIGECAPTALRCDAAQIARMWQREPFASLPPRQPVKRRGSWGVCGIARVSAKVGPSGLLYPCPRHPKPLGSLLEHRFEDLWQSADARALRKHKVRDLAGCTACDKFDICDRCGASALAETGDFLGTDPVACEVARARVICGRKGHIAVRTARPKR